MTHCLRLTRLVGFALARGRVGQCWGPGLDRQSYPCRRLRLWVILCAFQPAQDTGQSLDNGVETLRAQVVRPTPDDQD
jgi:hypothetical protein